MFTRGGFPCPLGIPAKNCSTSVAVTRTSRSKRARDAALRVADKARSQAGYQDALGTFSAELSDGQLRKVMEQRAYTRIDKAAKRKGKILVDYLRNGRGATAVSAYSTRARAG